MTLQLWNTLATFGTFLVIAATAIAALIQLRHLRAANEITYVRMFFEGYENPDFRPAFDFVRDELAERLKDPAFRVELAGTRPSRARHPEITILNLFDQWGLYYRDGVIDRDGFMRIFGSSPSTLWREVSCRL